MSYSKIYISIHSRKGMQPFIDYDEDFYSVFTLPPPTSSEHALVSSSSYTQGDLHAPQ